MHVVKIYSDNEFTVSIKKDKSGDITAMAVYCKNNGYMTNSNFVIWNYDWLENFNQCPQVSREGWDKFLDQEFKYSTHCKNFKAKFNSLVNKDG